MTILGEQTIDLIVECSHLFLAQVQHPDQLLKLDPIFSLITNFLGQIKGPGAIKVIEQIFAEAFRKVLAVGVPTSNTSDIEKTQNKTIMQFFRVVSKSCELSPSFLLT